MRGGNVALRMHLLLTKIPFQESSIIEAVEKQLQGTIPQPSLTPQMSKKPQMGTHVVQQHQQQQHDQQAITPLSGRMHTHFPITILRVMKINMPINLLSPVYEQKLVHHQN
jgi:hypothetical protein